MASKFKDSSGDNQGDKQGEAHSLRTPETVQTDVAGSPQREASTKTAVVNQKGSNITASSQSESKEEDPSRGGTPECSFLDCHCRLELSVPKFACPACAGTFCPSHAGKPSYELQIDRTGRFDPLNGIWQRVCQQCYVNRPGYTAILLTNLRAPGRTMNREGASRSLTVDFRQRRRLAIEKSERRRRQLESLLEKVRHVFVIG